MHNFHIPVMGIAYTVETPIKVGHFGINSVISIADHQLLEQLREYHCQKRNLPYQYIPEKHEEDARAEKIKAYLNLVKSIVRENFKSLKNADFKSGNSLTQYFEMLPKNSSLKQDYDQMLQLEGKEQEKAQEDLKNRITPGSIDVNIMTKLDKVNYTTQNKPLPAEYNDAHAALRGFANSNLTGNVVFSAGINTRLYTYMTNFEDFYPDQNGSIKKGIIIKVSDYKSALIQGKFLAKKGLWVSEFRVESGLNCGGHAFATDGHLLGPILQEFKDKRQELFDLLYDGYVQRFKQSEQEVPPKDSLPFSISVQGGVGSSEEQEFLISELNVDSVGWGSPFLLVPEAVTIDQASRKLVAEAGTKELYLSDISPLGVPFNSVKNTTEEENRQNRLLRGRPGSPCNKKYLVSNTEFSKEPVCTASRTYQKNKLNELEATPYNDEKAREKDYERIIQKTCICNGLTNPALIEKGLPPNLKDSGVSICPGPNMAYFKEVVSLKDMVQHIYGYINIIQDSNRPNLFFKELEQYVQYFRNYITYNPDQPMEKAINYLKNFRENLQVGITYYKEFFAQPKTSPINNSTDWLQKLEDYQLLVDKVMSKYLGDTLAFR